MCVSVDNYMYILIVLISIFSNMVRKNCFKKTIMIRRKVSDPNVHNV